MIHNNAKTNDGVLDWVGKMGKKLPNNLSILLYPTDCRNENMRQDMSIILKTFSFVQKVTEWNIMTLNADVPEVLTAKQLHDSSGCHKAPDEPE